MVTQGSPFLPQPSFNGKSLLNTKSIRFRICRWGEQSVSLLTVKCTNFKRGSDPALAKKRWPIVGMQQFSIQGTCGMRSRGKAHHLKMKPCLLSPLSLPQSFEARGSRDVPSPGLCSPVAQAVCLGGGHSALSPPSTVRASSRTCIYHLPRWTVPYLLSINICRRDSA